jgi:hypothetical protein
MKIAAAVAFAALAVACSSTSESTGSSNSAQITDVASMTKRSDGNFDVVCTDGTRAVVTPADVLANNVCSAGPSTSPILGRVFGRTDSCDGNPAITVRAETDCFSFSSSDAAWSIFVNGACQNIPDTDLRTACLSLNKTERAVFGRSDSCDGTPITKITDTTDCFALSTSDAAWSVWSNGACQNITDTDARSACLALEPTAKAVFGRSDSCDGAPIAKITSGFDCFTLSDHDAAWSVWVDGACKNISDTDARSACLAINPN